MTQLLPKLSMCSEEVMNLIERKSATECIETISESLETQQFVEHLLKNRHKSPPLVEADIQPPEPQSTQSCPMALPPSVCCQRKDSCELKRPTQFSPNTVECQLPSKVENVVPRKWESPLTQALRTTAPDADTFAQIPSKHSTSALAAALAVAPTSPFTPNISYGEPVPLPEYTDPYLPSERPIIPVEPKEPKPKPEKPKSQFVKALETAPERPFTPVGGTTPVKKKPKDPTDKYFEDLPKPQEKLSMLKALTTAPDRPYSPLVVESVVTKMGQTNDETSVKQKQSIERSKLQKITKPDVLPTSFKIHEKVPKPPSYYSPAVLYQRTQEVKSKEHTEEIDTSKTKTIEKQTIHNPEMTQIIVDENSSTPQNFAPLFQGFSCIYQNKKTNSQFSIEISTTPPMGTPPPKPLAPIVKTIESKPGYVEKETITEEKRERQQTTKREEHTKEDISLKQAEAVVYKKPTQPVILHKPDGLPQYQVQLSETAEADLRFIEKMQKAQYRLEQQKLAQSQQQEQMQQVTAAKRPVITVEPDEGTPRQAQSTFQPVMEDRPPSRTFSTRPGSITPSMINKPPPVLPYYQASLAPQHMPPPTINLLDPASPSISRSPSPCPGGGRERSLSPSPFRSSAGKAVSPAPGPPPNPLKLSKPLQTSADIRLKHARENITTFIPEYKNKVDVIEKDQTMEIYESAEERYGQVQPIQMYTSQIQTKTFPVQQQGVVFSKQRHGHIHQAEKLEVQEAARAQIYSSQTAESTVSTAIAEESHQAHLEQMKQSQSQIVEKSVDGLTQVQRKKTVTEEYERTQKETNIQIEKNVTTSKKLPFREVNPPAGEAPGVMSVHITNPHPLSRLTQRQQQQQICQQGCQQDYQQVCQKSAQSQSYQTTAAPIKHVFAPSSLAPIKHVDPPGFSKKSNQNVIRPNISRPNVGTSGGRQAGGVSVAPKRGRGVLNTAAIGGSRIPLCGHCHMQIRGPFITALGKIWCPSHFICSTPSCRRPLQDLGFVEERGQLYCEYCFEQYLAPPCAKCGAKVKGDCLKAIGKNFHPECFSCVYCGKLFGNSSFFLEDGNPYCEADWNELFTTKCFACGFPVEAGDRWVEALNNNYHSQCFNCTMCKKNLEGQSFFAKGGRPFCKNHAR